MNIDDSMILNKKRKQQGDYNSSRGTLDFLEFNNSGKDEKTETLSIHHNHDHAPSSFYDSEKEEKTKSLGHHHKQTLILLDSMTLREKRRQQGADLLNPRVNVTFVVNLDYAL